MGVLVGASIEQYSVWGWVGGREGGWVGVLVGASIEQYSVSGWVGGREGGW